MHDDRRRCLSSLMNETCRRVKGCDELLVISEVWHALFHAGQILHEFWARVCSVLFNVITNMTSFWEHIGTERLWVTGEEMGCLTDSQWAARIFPDCHTGVNSLLSLSRVLYCTACWVVLLCERYWTCVFQAESLITPDPVWAALSAGLSSSYLSNQSCRDQLWGANINMRVSQ